MPALVTNDVVDDVDDLSELPTSPKTTPTGSATEMVQSVAPPRNLTAITDVDCASAFAASKRGSLIYCVEQARWYGRDGQVFVPLCRVAMQGHSMDFLQSAAARRPEDDAKKLQTKSRINSTVELARSILSVNQAELDSDPDIVGCADGRVLDLSTGQIAESYSGYITRRIGTHFDPQAQCPIWHSFLESSFAGNTGKIEFIQRAIGYTLTGHVNEQSLFLLVGAGANGKSELVNLLGGLLGNYGGSTPMQSLMIQRNEQTADLAALAGLRFVVASEGEIDQRLAESKVKHMTGGDLITCRKLYRDFFSYKPAFKLWLATNHVPRITGADEGIWRRIRLIRFPITIPADKRDPHLSEKLKAELPGILNWALRGLHEWRKQRLNPPSDVIAETEAYRLDNDPVWRWIIAACDLNSSAIQSSGALHDSYTQWAAQSGGDPLSQKQFGTILAMKGFTKVKGRQNNSWKGISPR